MSDEDRYLFKEASDKDRYLSKEASDEAGNSAGHANAFSKCSPVLEHYRVQFKQLRDLSYPQQHLVRQE